MSNICNRGGQEFRGKSTRNFASYEKFLQLAKKISQLAKFLNHNVGPLPFSFYFIIIIIYLSKKNLLSLKYIYIYIIFFSK